MRKGKEKVFIVNTNIGKMTIDNKKIQIQDIQELKEPQAVTFTFDTAKDFFIFGLSGLIQKIKGLPESNSLKSKVKELEEMRAFFDTRVTAFRIAPSPGSPIPYRYDVAYRAIGKETKEEVEQRIKTYLHSQPFNMILGQADPRVLEILRQKEDLRKKEEDLARREAELKRKESKVGKFKRSGHLTDQILQYNYPKEKKQQLGLFDRLNQATMKEIEKSGIEKKEIVEGIKLSPSETKVIDCLCKLLHENSQISDPKEESYYSGNLDFDVMDYGTEKDTPAPKLAFTLYELTREYKGGEIISGKDVENVKQILNDLDNKRFLLSYVETVRTVGGGRVERKIEDFRKLIHIVKISQTEYSKEDIELSRQEETVIVLSPIFRRQIDSKFILYPNDITRRTIIAYGSHNLSDIALRLRDYLMREHSSKRFKPEIGMEKLYYLLSEKWMNESRKSMVKKYTDKALETVKNLGILLSYEIKPTSSGDKKIVFTLNKNWE
jgi:hypothetical protein